MKLCSTDIATLRAHMPLHLMNDQLVRNIFWAYHLLILDIYSRKFLIKQIFGNPQNFISSKISRPIVNNSCTLYIATII